MPNGPEKLQVKLGVFLVLIGFIMGVFADPISSSNGNDYGLHVLGSDPNAIVFLNPDLVVWPNSRVETIYKTNGLIAAEELEWVLSNAFAKISKRIHVEFVLSGNTEVDLVNGDAPPAVGVLLVEVIRNDEMTKRFGSDFSGYAYIWWDGAIIGAQIALNAGLLNKSNCWQGTVLHELGHVMNLGHPVQDESTLSVMFEPPSSCEYRTTLRKFDIDNLSAMYAIKPHAYAPEITSATSTEICIYVPNIDAFGKDYQFEACVPAYAFGDVHENLE